MVFQAKKSYFKTFNSLKFQKSKSIWPINNIKQDEEYEAHDKRY